MIKITVTEPAKPVRRQRSLVPLALEDVTSGTLQEGEGLDFKRMVDIERPETKRGFIDDVVAFLNRGPGRIVVGVEEKGGRFDSLRPLSGDPDKVTLRFQTMIQDSIMPIPVDVQVVPLHLNEGFLLDIQIPAHIGAPFMNRHSGSYVMRSGSRNMPMDPGELRSRLADETTWIARLDEFAAAEDAAVSANGRLAQRQALRIAILPREHFDHRHEPFAQGSHVRYPGPVFHEHGDPFFKVTEDGHESYSQTIDSKGIERLFIRDDWFIHAFAAHALIQTGGEGRLAVVEFEDATKRYLAALSGFLVEQEIHGPFAITLSLQGLDEDDHFGAWFRNTSTVRTLRPRLVQDLDDPEILHPFFERVRQARYS